MKRYLLPILAILALASCSKDQNGVELENSGNPLLFDMGVATKSTLYNDEAEIRGTAIGLYGSIRNSNGTGTLIFNNDDLKYSNGSWSYDIDTETAGNQYRYWSNGNFYYFAGIWPKNTSSYSYNEATGVLTYNCTTGLSLSAIDVMYATASRDLSNAPEVEGDYSPVPFVLKHAFAALEFRVVNASGSEITNIGKPQLTKLKNKGTLTVSSTGSAIWALDDASKVTGTEYSETSSFIISSMASDATAEPAQLYSGTDILVLPQAVLGTDIQFQFSFTKDKKQTTPSYDLADVTIIDQWKAGKIYTYTATITTDYITFSVSIRDWVTEEYELK